MQIDFQYFRTPKTMNEYRQYFGAADSDVVKVRAKRNPKNLPNAWDDINFADRKVETRRQQYQSRPNYRDSIRYMGE